MVLAMLAGRAPLATRVEGHPLPAVWLLQKSRVCLLLAVEVPRGSIVENPKSAKGSRVPLATKLSSKGVLAEPIADKVITPS